MNVLVVDDDIAVRSYLSRWLTKDKCTVTTAEKSEDCMRHMQADNFSLALIDVNLGGEDGITLAQSMKQKNPLLKIILMSGDPGNAERAKAAGFADMLTKPFDLDRLKKLVAHAG